VKRKAIKNSRIKKITNKINNQKTVKRKTNNKGSRATRNNRKKTARKVIRIKKITSFPMQQKN
jgi:hypothetical protein